MKKRLLALGLNFMLCLCMLAACGGSGNEKSTTGKSDAGKGTEAVVGDSSGNAPEAESSERSDEKELSGNHAVAGETAHIVVSILVQPGANTAALADVQAAVNAITVPEINVEVELKPVELFSAATQYPLWISSNEDLDVICTAFTGISEFVSQGMLEPMDGLISDYAPYITEMMTEFDLENGGFYQGETYGINPVDLYYGTRYGAIFRTDLLEEAGYAIDPDKTYTLDELEDILSKVKENHPEMYPLAVTGGDINSSLDLYTYVETMDNLASSYASGVLIGTDSTVVENMFATDSYYDFVKRMSLWKELGYIHPDAATTDTTSLDFLKNEVSGGYLMRTTPEQITGAKNQMTGKDVEFTAINLTDYFYPTYKGNVLWSIPISCDQPEAAMRYLNLLYENHDLSTILMYGPEGVNWERTDRDDLIAYPEGVDSTNVTYANGLGLFGDRRFERSYSQDVSREAYDAVTEASLKNPTASKGFIYDTTNTAAQIMSVNTVLEQYLPQLECGVSADSLDSIYNTFLSELEAAGIDDIIADKQAQLDAYLAEQ